MNCRLLLEEVIYMGFDAFTWEKDNTYLATTDVSSSNGLNVYPNPTKGEITLKSTENTTVDIYDYTGKIIHSSEVVKGENKIDLSSSPAGVYILKTDK